MFCKLLPDLQALLVDDSQNGAVSSAILSAKVSALRLSGPQLEQLTIFTEKTSFERGPLVLTALCSTLVSLIKEVLACSL